ncbi:hypothetical protein AwPolaro_01060 [Polaromonas sp.]|nr:hypothetical protein AwPolaro_01060 [Polaromonas sp.]
MLHPLFSTLIQRPDLVIDHVSAYGALFHEEASDAGAELLKRIMAWAVSVLAATLFLGLTGAALMLGLMNNQFHWVLLAVPAVALLLLIAALWVATRPRQSKRFPILQAQLHRDAVALRSVV